MGLNMSVMMAFLFLRYLDSFSDSIYTIKKQKNIELPEIELDLRIDQIGRTVMKITKMIGKTDLS